MIIKLEDSRDSKPLYIQVYDHIATEIKAGRLKSGDKLPSKKELCRDLGVSQTTVENAYEMLMTEGYIDSKPRKGYFVEKYTQMPETGRKNITGIEVSKNVIETEKNAVSAVSDRHYAYSLNTGSIDTAAFPYATWARLGKNVMYNEPELLERGEGNGDRDFREELVRYLHEYRGVNADAMQIVTGAGTEYLLSLLCRMLPPDSYAAVEDPGYVRIARNMADNRMNVIPVEVGADGIDMGKLEKTCADICYVTPSHQFPTGVTMPVGKRMQLLGWAAEKQDRYILEDDYDSEFRLSGRPFPSLQSSDTADRVIYIGTFSRSMAPSIRISYMILPPRLLKIYQERFAYNACTVSRFEQQTMRAFLAGGYYERHINRMRTLYKKKSEYLISCIHSQIGHEKYTLIRENTGLHFLMYLGGGADGEMVRKRAADKGLELSLLSDFRINEPSESDRATLVVGFAGLDMKKIAESVKILSEIL